MGQIKLGQCILIVCCIFYLLYYRVKPMTGYLFGMVPLITEAITMGIFEFFVG